MSRDNDYGQNERSTKHRYRNPIEFSPIKQKKNPEYHNQLYKLRIEIRIVQNRQKSTNSVSGSRNFRRITGRIDCRTAKPLT